MIRFPDLWETRLLNLLLLKNYTSDAKKWDFLNLEIKYLTLYTLKSTMILGIWKVTKDLITFFNNPPYPQLPKYPDAQSPYHIFLQLLTSLTASYIPYSFLTWISCNLLLFCNSLACLSSTWLRKITVFDS
jgi:hypothetical protein